MELQNIISQIDSLKQELSTYQPLPPDIEQKVMQKFRLDWNYNSNNIEGNSLTYGETKALILFGITAQGKPIKDHIEIEGHNEAIDEVLQVVRQQKPLTEALIRNLHKLILHEPYEIDAITPDGQPTKRMVKIGEYKSQPNHVKTVTGEIFRFAEPFETPALMQDLINWYNENLKNVELHSLLLAAEFHYRFIRIHPFDDGNGRLVRILMNLILMQKGYPPVIIRSEDKENYIRNLQLADSGNLEPFIEYIGNRLITSLEIMLKGAKGEEIDEPEDISKKIRLLSAKLDELENEEIDKGKSTQNLKTIFDNSILPLFNNLFNKISELEKLFKHNFIDVNFIPHNTLRTRREKFNSIVTSEFNQRINYIEGININLQYESLNKFGYEGIGINIVLKISLNRFNFTILDEKAKIKIERKYTDTISEETMNKYNDRLISYYLESLDKEIDKRKALS